MSHTYTCKGNRRYRYYLCGHAQRNGRDQCPAPSVPAGEIERFVVDQIHQIGTDPTLIAETIRQVRLQSEDGITHLTEEHTSLQLQLRSHHADLQTIANQPSTTKWVSQLADLQEQLRITECRLTEIDSELVALRANQIDESEVTRLLAEFQQTWEALAPRDQARVLELLIERIDYRGQDGQISLTFRPSGIQTLTRETAV